MDRKPNGAEVIAEKEETGWSFWISYSSPRRWPLLQVLSCWWIFKWVELEIHPGVPVYWNKVDNLGGTFGGERKHVADQASLLERVLAEISAYGLVILKIWYGGLFCWIWDGLEAFFMDFYKLKAHAHKTEMWISNESHIFVCILQKLFQKTWKCHNSYKTNHSKSLSIKIQTWHSPGDGNLVGY